MAICEDKYFTKYGSDAFSYCFARNLLPCLSAKEFWILKINQHLAKLEAKILWHLYFPDTVYNNCLSSRQFSTCRHFKSTLSLFNSLTYSSIVHSCNVHPCDFHRPCPLLQCPPIKYPPWLSIPAMSPPACSAIPLDAYGLRRCFHNQKVETQTATLTCWRSSRHAYASESTRSALPSLNVSPCRASSTYASSTGPSVRSTRTSASRSSLNAAIWARMSSRSFTGRDSRFCRSSTNSKSASMSPLQVSFSRRP